MCRNFPFIILLSICFGLVYTKGVNNVCRSYDGYFTDKDKNPECFYDPDLDANFEQRAKNHGLLAEKHYIPTEDGYILTTFRLKYSNGTYGKGIVFLQHGLGTDSTIFTGNGKKSISYVLAKQGYDVWLGNFRGTEFSSHKNLQRNDKQFWDFCYHEHGLYDLPANFKYILAKTKSRIFYVGHSMGGTALAIYFSTQPEEASKFVKYTTFLNGGFYLRYTKGLLNYTFINNLYDLLTLISKSNIIYAFGATDSFERKLAFQTCFASKENLKLCITLGNYVSGSGGYRLSPEKCLVAAQSIRNLCFKQMFHFAQAIRSREFRMFDYGLKENMIRYNSRIPPSYDLSKLPNNITWIYGAYDQLVTKQDYLYAINKYRKPNWEAYEIPYNHINHFYDYKYADKTLLPLLLKIINKHI